MTGIELIAKERQEQIEKHGRPTERDVIENNNGELIMGVKALVNDDGLLFPGKWDMSICVKMFNKTYEERLVIAGALIAAEIDRLKHINSNPCKNLEGLN